MVCLLVLGLTGLSACATGGEGPPDVSLDEGLRLALEQEREQPLRVISTAPEGPIGSEGAQVQVVFSKPVRGLTLADEEVPVPLRVDPPIEGSFQWVGTNAVVLHPKEGAVRPATAYTVSVPAGVRALDGSALEEGVTFSFETARPEVVDIGQQGGNYGTTPESSFRVTTNLPVNPDALRAVTRLLVGPRAEESKSEPTAQFPFRLQRVAEDPLALLVVPRRPLPLDANVVVRVERGLLSEAGPLESLEPREARFETYGPLQSELRCMSDTDSCVGRPALVFNTPVALAELRHKVRIEPGAGPLFDARVSEDTPNGAYPLGGRYRRDVRYRVVLEPGIRDVYGQELTERRELTFRMGAGRPLIELGVTSGFVEPSLGSNVVITSVNVPEYERLTRSLSPLDVAKLVRTNGEPLDVFPDLQRVTVRTRAAFNWQDEHPISFRSVLGKPRGPMLVGYSYFDPEQEAVDTRLDLVHSTDLALHLRGSAAGGLAWVTRLGDGRPVPNATVRVVDLAGASGYGFQTDPDGVARIPAAELAEGLEDPGGIVVAESGDDWVYTNLHGRSGYEPKELRHVFTDRGIYRPGERIHVKGWLRRETTSGTEPLPGRQVTLTLSDGSTEHPAVVTQSNAFGGFDATLQIPSYARRVRHRLSVSTAGSTTWTTLRVGEYRSAEFSVEVDSGDETRIRGQDILATVRGEYLFGGPMAGAGVEWTTRGEPSHFSPPGSDGFDTNGWAYQIELRELLGLEGPRDVESESNLDPEGSSRATFSTRFEALGPMSYRVTAVVSDASRQTVAVSSRTLVHPGEFYLGVAVADGQHGVGAALRPRVRTFAPTGEPIAGRSVRAELYRLMWRDDYTRELVRVTACSATTTLAETGCALVPQQSGTHVVLVRSKDDAGNDIFAATRAQVGAHDFRGPASWETAEPTVELDRAVYRAGDVARVRVTTPEPASEVLLSLEQDGVLWHGRKTARAGVAEFEVPVSEDVARNARLTAVVVRGQRQRGSKAWHEAYRPLELSPRVWTASATLEIDQTPKRLSVVVTPEKTATTPGADVRVRIDVKDQLGAGLPVELALALVDEGVLMLTDHEVPDPFASFTPSRDDIVSALDSRDQLGWIYVPELEEAAMDGGHFGYGYGSLGGSHVTRAPKVRMGGSRVRGRSLDVRDDFATTPYWNPSVLTDENGHAEVTVPLSEQVTRFRLMAVAIGKGDRFGLGEAGIETRLPLMIRPAMPRFARVGDSFLAGVLISSTEVDSDATDVTVTARGVRVEGSNHERVTIGRNQTREVRFSFRADEPGTAELEFRVRSGGFDDAVRMTIPVSVPLTPEAVAVYGKTDGASGERISNLAGASPHFGELAVSMASTALVGLDDAIEGLETYPYDCTEQLTSRLLPLLPLRDLARDFGIAGSETEDEDIQSLLTEILGRQRHDGGFGLWPNDPGSHPWVSAYVARLLDEASRRGVAVPEEAKERVFSHLLDIANGIGAEQYHRPSLAYVAHVLAENGTPSRVLIERLMEEDLGDPTFARALQLQTLALVLQDPSKTEASSDRVAAWSRLVAEQAKRVERALRSKVRLSGNLAFVEADEGGDYAWLFDSRTRTHALVLSAFLAYDPKHPLAEPLARGLLSARRGGGFRSTQEAAFALLALDSYRQKQEATAPSFDATVWLGERALGQSRHRERSLAAGGFVVPMRDLPRAGDALVFQKEGRGTLFYQALLRYSPKELPLEPLDHGFFIDSKLYAVPRGELPAAVRQGYAPGQVRFFAGDVVLGDVTVIVPVERNFVAIEVPLPAGFEAIDLSLATQAEQPFVDLESPAYVADWSRRELRDDRVLYFLNRMNPGTHRFTYLARATSSGTFVLPPVTVSEMYAPENFGRTGGRTISVAAARRPR